MIEASSNPFVYLKIPQGDPVLSEIYRLRYKVYCEEWEFEKKEDHPEEIEKDEYDEHSTHFVVRRKEEDRIIGTIRMINNSERGFPIEKHCRIEANLSSIDKNRLGEISRLAISKEYRRRATDKVYYDGSVLEDRTIDAMFKGSRKISNDIVLGLYKCVYKEGMESDHRYLLAVMAKGLFVLLKRVGIVFEQIGPDQYYHGTRSGSK